MSLPEIKAWLVPMLRSWAGQKRAMWEGRTREGDVDGWPATTVIAKIRLEREGAGQGSGAQQHFAEVLRGDALVIARAMDGMPGESFDVIYLHYLIHRPVEWKAEHWGWSPAHYWRTLDLAYAYVAGRIDLADQKRAKAAKNT